MRKIKAKWKKRNISYTLPCNAFVQCEDVNELANCHRNEINYLCVSSVKLTIFTCFKRKIERA